MTLLILSALKFNSDESHNHEPKQWSFYKTKMTLWPTFNKEILVIIFKGKSFDG